MKIVSHNNIVFRVKNDEFKSLLKMVDDLSKLMSSNLSKEYFKKEDEIEKYLLSLSEKNVITKVDFIFNTKNYG